MAILSGMGGTKVDRFREAGTVCYWEACKSSVSVGFWPKAEPGSLRAA